MNKKDFANMMEKMLLNKKEVRVGKVDEAYVNLVKAIHEDAKTFIAEMEKKVKTYEEKSEKQLANVWECIYNELEIPEDKREEPYEINPITGVVTRIEYGPSVLDKIVLGDEEFLKQFKQDVDRAHTMKEAKKDKQLH